MKVIAIIPVRMGSSRFPGKPLAKILDRSMVEHVYRRAALSTSLDEVVIATCDDEIKIEAESFGATVIMTSNSHERASDRIAEVAQTLEANIYVLIQGDEPMTTPEMIDSAIVPMLDDDTIQCVNLTKKIDSEEEYLSPNTIKVVLDHQHNALFMSREPIPTLTNNSFDQITAYKQVCIMPFRWEALMRFAALEPTQLEIAESIDMLRFLENGVPVRMVETDTETHAVDTPADLKYVSSLMEHDTLISAY